MISNDIYKAAKEFNCILENSSNEVVEKIPKKFRNFLKSIEDKDYIFNYDKTKKLNDQNLKSETRDIIAMVYRKYICN